MHDMPMMASTAPAESVDAAWLAAAKAAYPHTVCVVSGEELIDGDMGAPIDYVHKVDGQPDRLVRFCCEDCVGDFKKDPAKYLALIDEAAGTRAKMDKAAGHDSHQH